MAERYWAFRYEGRDMHPRIMQNEVVIYDSEEAVHPGDDVVIELPNGQWIVRSLVSFDDNTLRMKTYSPAAASTLARDKVKALYPIISRMKSADFEKLKDEGASA